MTIKLSATVLILLLMIICNLQAVNAGAQQDDPSNNIKIDQQSSCCGGDDAESWAVFRMLDGQLMDYRPISFRKPKQFTARISSDHRAEPIELKVLAFGDGITGDDIPELGEERLWYTAFLRGVGYMAAEQVVPGETWIFKFGSEYMEKRIPASGREFKLAWQFSNAAGESVSFGELDINNMYKIKRECRNKEGVVTSSFMYRAATVSQSEVNREWLETDWVGIGLPEEFGEMYLSRGGEVSSGTVTVDGYEYFFELSAQNS